jgi:hypothetical protein
VLLCTHAPYVPSKQAEHVGVASADVNTEATTTATTTARITRVEGKSLEKSFECVCVCEARGTTTQEISHTPLPIHSLIGLDNNHSNYPHLTWRFQDPTLPLAPSLTR